MKHGSSESTAVGPSPRNTPRRDAARRPNSRDPGNGNHWPTAETQCDRQLIRIINSIAFGIPVNASIDPKSEIEELMNASGSGWVADADDPEAFAQQAAESPRISGPVKTALVSGFDFAKAHMSPRESAADEMRTCKR